MSGLNEKHTMMIHCGTVNSSNRESIHDLAFWMTKDKSLNVSVLTVTFKPLTNL